MQRQTKMLFPAFLIVMVAWASHVSHSEALPFSCLSSILNKNRVATQPVKTHSSHTWFIQHPFDGANPQSLGPPLHENDPQKMEPVHLPKVPERGEARHSAILYQRCIDADTCLLKIQGDGNTRERNLTVKLVGIDAPHIQGRCEQEVSLAKNAIELLDQVLSDAVQIDLYDHYEVGLHHEARLVADGQDLSQLLLDQGLAMTHQNKTKDWCID